MVIVHGASVDDDVSISPVPALVAREEPLSPKPSRDEGPSMAATALSESEVSSTGVEVVPTDVPTTTTMVAKATTAEAQTCLETAQHQEELELNLAELTKKWDSQVVELQAETERLSVIRSQVIPINPRALKEQAQKGAHEVRDTRVAECVAQIHTFYQLSL
ncbi:uncharacterized protein A4U43_C03F3090 [Asparagus officinalis]|uniref:Uncharacterized protein n=1 Tax=Asparagus officinalis TaxID=4686 RepID=A0A5P1FBX0_ASPOF|nr:uncharacterized protein A4U43_C03F3090 [Asparagus officinalis]